LEENERSGGSQTAKREGGERREEERRRREKKGGKREGFGTAISPHNSEAAGRVEVTEVASVGVSNAREGGGPENSAYAVHLAAACRIEGNETAAC
jgi:hypothetical protein